MHVGTLSTISEPEEFPEPLEPNPELLQVTPGMLMRDGPEDVQRKLLFHVKRFGEFQANGLLFLDWDKRSNT